MAKKPKILEDIDDFALKKIKQETKLEEVKIQYTKENCKKCQIGNMIEVYPGYELQKLKLFECELCKEREYL